MKPGFREPQRSSHPEPNQLEGKIDLLCESFAATSIRANTHSAISDIRVGDHETDDSDGAEKCLDCLRARIETVLGQLDSS